VGPAQRYTRLSVTSRRSGIYPVDGGVLDVPTGKDEVIVPTRTSLRVENSVLFAVTRERPGGVVVSDRSHLVIAAKP